MRIIKFQNLFWIFVVVLISACNPSKSSQPAEMPQPKLTIYPQPIISTTLTATPSSTPTPINTPLLETATPVPAPSRPNIQELNSVGCMGLEDRWDCIDTYLEIEFQTPFDWRMYRSTLSQATCGGYLYGYEPPRFGMFEFLGQSRDFCAPTDEYTFVGFNSAQEFCQSFGSAASCESISKEVVLSVYFPESGSVCNPGPGMIYFPIARVGIKLDGRHKIDSLVFSREFLSTKAKESLYQPLGAGLRNCTDEAARKKFDEISRKLADDLLHDRADEETTYLFQQIIDFAKSIIIKKAP